MRRAIMNKTRLLRSVLRRYIAIRTGDALLLETEDAFLTEEGDALLLG